MIARPTCSVARMTMVLVVATALANAGWIWLAGRCGWEINHSSFLGPREDRFADFFKVAFSYPGTRPFAATDLLGMRGHLLAHMLRDYDPAVPGANNIGHFHLTPLTTLLAIGAGRAMRWVEPAVLLLAVWTALSLYAARIVSRLTQAPAERAAWLVALFVSYPMLLAWDRGNLFAALAGLLLLYALLLGADGRHSLPAALLLALAMQIRPNLGLFLLPLMLWSGREAGRVALAGIGAAAVIVVAAFDAAHLLHPSYTPASFVDGLGLYRRLYVVDAHGLAGGSSLLGAAKFLFGFRLGLDQLIGVAALGPVGAAVVLRRYLDHPTLLFLVAAATTLGSGVFADYHLLMFVAVPMLSAAERRPVARGLLATPGGIALAASWAMLVPKNYLYDGEISIQVLLNPLLLLVATAAILATAVAAAWRDRERKGLAIV